MFVLMKNYNATELSAIKIKSYNINNILYNPNNVMKTATMCLADVDENGNHVPQNHEAVAQTR